MIYALTCDGAVSVDTGGAPLCSGSWVLIQLPEQFDPSQLDPAVLAQLFGIGFSLVTTVLLIGIGCKAILDFIRRG
ncbi:hypothetical protein [Pseudomonas sp. NCCP-436]|uniref:hypothetical protein n=1 Tax=Pseudomonas sp. NCCP-436 TaxID=2842481 RepID=UPI001C7E8FA2|nr:hypothetical protein [Pseudomonas sp. NCCP-436]GIZ13884.1 hypothetical protein NCCP436_33000 [Pseudomonas sp. NCCP-436]